jgi:outer membrane protein assembly factor BamB/orotate phosphoribosyltransferase
MFDTIDTSARPMRPPRQAKAALERIRRTPEWELLRREIYTEALRFSGKLAFDFRLLLTQPRLAEIAGRLMWQLIRPFGATVIVGPGFGAAPLLFSIAMSALREGQSLQVLMVRDKRKEHNMKRWVEGRRAPAGSVAVIVDDFMEGGSAVPLVERALKADRHELEIAAVALFFDMWQPLGSRQISVGRMPVVPLFKRHDIGLARDSFDATPPLMKGGFPPFVGKPLWWRFALNAKRGSYPFKCAPLIAEDAVFAADDHCNVWRHNLHDGSIEWKYESLADPLKGIVQLLQYARGSLVFGCYDGTITRLDAASGAVQWRVRQDSSIHATPAVDAAHGRVFVNTEQWNSGAPLGSLVALDWSSGRMVWQHRHRYWAPGSPYYCARNDVVLATCNDATMVCVEAASGMLRWKFGTTGLVRGRPVVVGARAYAATEKGRLHCIDVASGEEQWTIRYGKGLKHVFLAAHGGCLYLFDGKWHLSAFDAQSGKLRWISRLRSPGAWCPLACGGYLAALSTGGHIAVLDPRRELKVWEDSIGGTYMQPPAIAAGYLAAASNNQGLKLFKINDFYLQEASTAHEHVRESVEPA